MLLVFIPFTFYSDRIFCTFCNFFKKDFLIKKKILYLLLLLFIYFTHLSLPWCPVFFFYLPLFFLLFFKFLDFFFFLICFMLHSFSLLSYPHVIILHHQPMVVLVNTYNCDYYQRKNILKDGLPRWVQDSFPLFMSLLCDFFILSYPISILFILLCFSLHLTQYYHSSFYMIFNFSVLRYIPLLISYLF